MSDMDWVSLDLSIMVSPLSNRQRMCSYIYFISQINNTNYNHTVSRAFTKRKPLPSASDVTAWTRPTLCPPLVTGWTRPPGRIPPHRGRSAASRQQRTQIVNQQANARSHHS